MMQAMKALGGLFIITAIFLCTSCGSPFDILGKGARTDCFYLDSDSLKIVYDCDDRMIFEALIYENESREQLFGKLVYRKEWKEFVKEFHLPMERDSIAGKYLQVELHITNTHFRETYYIDIAPGDLERKKKIAARYFSH